ncbi:hypothetical protein ACFL2T_02955 [Elusimicrobiota bacterium]
MLIAAWMTGIFASLAFCAAAGSGSVDETGSFRPRSGSFELLSSSTADSDPVVFVWEISDDPDWFQPYQGADAIYQDFARWVRAHADPEPKALLSRNRGILKKRGLSTKRDDLILSGRLGKIRPINRLEAEVYLLQLDSFGKPYTGEILAFVVRKGGRLRIYGYATASQRIKPGILRGRLKKDIADDWEYFAAFHNHPFIFSDKDMTYGELGPSGDATDGDIQYMLADFENLGLRRALITNGLDTIEFEAKEFPALAASPDPHKKKRGVSDKAAFHLLVSNQSFAVTPVDIHISVDGKTIIDEMFEVGDQHNFKDIELQLPHGRHVLQVASRTGAARLSQEFFLSSELWGSVIYEYYPESHYSPTPRKFVFHTQNKRMLFK